MAPVLSDLRDRKSDLVLARLMPQITKDSLANDLNVDVLFDDPLVVAVGPQSRWASRRTIDLSELAEAHWILPDPHSLNHAGVARAFQARGLVLPKVDVVTFSIPLRIHLLIEGDYVTSLPESVAKIYAVKVLPIKLNVKPWSVVTITLKNRTLSPVVERFIECAREVGKSFGTANR
jgi:DNA-binding transcriptional LysR family regulator